MSLKYSRQREAIRSFLLTRKDHPTVDMVYENVRKTYPNISLGTVYRNLQLLSELGEIQKINVGDGLDHFDADISSHHHFICSHCGSVIDLDMDDVDFLPKMAEKNFSGKIDGCTVFFYGMCYNCCHK